MALDDRRRSQLHEIRDLCLGKGASRMAVTAGVVKTTSPMSRSRTSRIFIARGRRIRALSLVSTLAAWNNPISLTRGAALVLPVGPRGHSQRAAARRGAIRGSAGRPVGHSLLRVHSRPAPRIPRPDPAGARSGRGWPPRPTRRAPSFPPRSPPSTPAPTAPRTPPRRPGGAGHRSQRTPTRTGCSARSSPPSSRAVSEAGRPATGSKPTLDDAISHLERARQAVRSTPAWP